MAKNTDDSSENSQKTSIEHGKKKDKSFSDYLHIDFFHSNLNPDENKRKYLSIHYLKKKTGIIAGSILLSFIMYQWGQYSTINPYTNSDPQIIRLPYYLNQKINDIVFYGQPVVLYNDIPVNDSTSYLTELDQVQTHADGSFSIDSKKLKEDLDFLYSETEHASNDQDYKYHAMQFYDKARDLNRSYVPEAIKKEFVSHALKTLKRLYAIELSEMKASKNSAFPFGSEYEDLFYQQFAQINVLYFGILDQMLGNPETYTNETEKKLWQFLGEPERHVFLSFTMLSD